jgi:hypothetical protein
MDSVLAPDIFNHVPKELVGFLEDHLPYSIPLLRRLQYAGFAHGDGWTSSSRVIVSPSLNSLEHTTNANFAAAFFDLSTGTETHMWMYSTTEDIDNRGDPAGSGSGNSADGEDNIVAIIDGAIDIQVQMANTTSTTTPPPTTIIVGSLHKKTRSIIERRTSRIVPYPGEETTVYYYDKWLMDVKSLPTATQQLPPGMRWDTATLSDCEIAAAKIPYPRLPYVNLAESPTLAFPSLQSTNKFVDRTTLLAMPNVVIRLENGTPVVWGFLGEWVDLVQDPSLTAVSDILPPEP